MDAKLKKLYEQAMIARDKYRMGKLSRDEVEKIVAPYLQRVNERAEINARRFGVSFQKISISGFLR